MKGNMAEQSTALKAPPATARLKVDVWVHFGFKKDGEKKRRVGQTTGNMQTMQRDGEILWEYDESPQPLDKTSPGRNTVDAAQTKPAWSRCWPLSYWQALNAHRRWRRLLQFLYAKTFERSRIKTLEPRYVLPTRKQLSEVTVPNMYASLKQGRRHFASVSR